MSSVFLSHIEVTEKNFKKMNKNKAITVLKTKERKLMVDQNI